MPAAPGSKIPDLRLHRSTGQAVVRLVNPRGGRRDYYLGKFGTEDSRQRYQQIVARWIANGRELPSMRVPVAGEIPSTVHLPELIAVPGLLNALAAAPTTHPERRTVGWEDYVRSTDRNVARIDEAIFELVHQVAGLAAVDGAVVLDKRFELLGFGAEIGGDLPAVRTVARALDAEGTAKAHESVESDGTRHRSAYRLCSFVHDALAIVVSQDGTVRFVKWHEGEVTYWDHASTSVLAV